MVSITADVLTAVVAEMARQQTLKAQGKFKNTVSDPIPNDSRYKILMEEVGEVSRVMCEGLEADLDVAHLREELIQVAAVAVAFVEGIDRDAAHQRDIGTVP